MRKRIYEIIEVAKRNDLASRIYDFFLIGVIALSLVPIIARLNTETTLAIDTFALIIFIGDYFLRWLTADYKYKSSSAISFIRYPFSLPAIIDLLVIISLLPIDYSGSTLGFMELFRIVRTFRVFRLAHYSRSVELILKVFRRQKNPLLTVVIFTTFYILVSALIVFTAEPGTFDTFFDAVYWATASLTTIGYGDTVTTSSIGRIITMLSSLCGILVVALPTGIITAGYVKITHEEQRRNERLALATAEKIHEKVKKVEQENKEEDAKIKKVEQVVNKISKKWKTL